MSNFEKLKAAFKASTQDPWSSSFTEWKLLRNNVMCNNYFVAQVFVDGDCQVAANIRLANAEFIILAYNMMPKILSDLERLQKLEA
jgi:hypothetical protein